MSLLENDFHDMSNIKVAFRSKEQEIWFSTFMTSLIENNIKRLSTVPLVTLIEQSIPGFEVYLRNRLINKSITKRRYNSAIQTVEILNSYLYDHGAILTQYQRPLIKKESTAKKSKKTKSIQVETKTLSTRSFSYVSSMCSYFSNYIMRCEETNDTCIHERKFATLYFINFLRDINSQDISIDDLIRKISL
jgi:hypothetical protein